MLPWKRVSRDLEGQRRCPEGRERWPGGQKRDLEGRDVRSTAPRRPEAGRPAARRGGPALVLTVSLAAASLAGCTVGATTAATPTATTAATPTATTAATPTATTAATPTAGATASRSAPGIGKIRHVVVIMQENRSFDSFFGTYPGADGLPVKNGQFTVCVPDPRTHGCDRPYHDPSLVNGGASHSRAAQQADIDGGRM